MVDLPGVDDFTNETVAALVKKAVDLRQENFFSQQQVCEKMGLRSHGSLAMIEQGKTIPKLDTFVRLLSVYGYTLEIVEK